ncbi:MAG: LysE family translocator [Boseongicola sp.]|nr:LysE family translocator [Silicimonas sp.]NNF92651.1 LysE family translocator [Boseongicola sp.]RZW01747.1 MAG: LysE family translocator [Paracoccaceae bacterium]NND21139.1 LysE family translocator [Silicimonas sp.]NNL35879.1 LysE family translocator [Silicimonas sp.]
MTLAAFIGIALIHLAAAISPGPSFVVAVRTAAAEGMVPASGVAVGFGLGAVVWALAALLGLAVLFEIAPAMMTGFKMIGAALLLFIAWKTWTHASEPMPSARDAMGGRPPRSFASAVRLGLATQLANPKPAIFFGAVFVGLVPPETSALVLALLLTVIGTQETLWYILVGRVFSLDRSRAAYGRFKATIDRAFGGLIALLAAKIALT